MVLDLELRQSSLGHFGRWAYQKDPHTGQDQMDENLLGRQSLRANTLLNEVSAINSLNNTAGASSATVFDTTMNLPTELNQLMAARIEVLSRPLTDAGSSTLDHSISEREVLDGTLRDSQHIFQSMGSKTIAGGATLEREAVKKSGPLPLFNFKRSAPSKRRRALHDVDGPGTGQLSCKKRRLRLQLITSRLSQPFSLPATHILNRESDEHTPVISRFVKLAALGAKKAGHQTALVRKAAILNRVRLNVRQAAVTRGHDRIWKMAGMGAMSHGLQLVTDSTGAMFPGRSGEQVPGPKVPRAWRPHTTASNTNPPVGLLLPRAHIMENGLINYNPNPVPRNISTPNQTVPQDTPPPTSIMTPLAGADEDEASFPGSDLDSRYADASDDDDADDVYADFGVLFGGGASSPEDSGDDEHFYEEYLDEVDGISWAS